MQQFKRRSIASKSNVKEFPVELPNKSYINSLS